MKHYDQGKWAIQFIFTLDGSVIPKAVTWAVPAAFMAVGWNMFYFQTGSAPEWVNHQSDMSAVAILWGGFTTILGFLVVFRSQQAYTRYWEGASLLREIRGEWLNAVSSLIAFCTTDKQRRTEVEAYQHLLVRLMSMLHCCALQTVADMDDALFQRFSDVGIEDKSLEFLAGLEDKRHRCEVLVQWIQRLTVQGCSSGLISVSAPIVTRVYQEISRGIVKLSNARKLTEIPFPFPFAQMLQCMLLTYSFFTPLAAGVVVHNTAWAALLTFFAVFAFTGVNYIAIEIESPFGEDRNDLPLDEQQEEMNESLWILLEKLSQEPPAFEFNKTVHRKYSNNRTSLTDARGLLHPHSEANVRASTRSKASTGSYRGVRTSIFATTLFRLGTRTSRSDFGSHDLGPMRSNSTQSISDLQSESSDCQGLQSDVLSAGVASASASGSTGILRANSSATPVNGTSSPTSSNYASNFKRRESKKKTPSVSRGNTSYRLDYRKNSAGASSKISSFKDWSSQEEASDISSEGATVAVHSSKLIKPLTLDPQLQALKEGMMANLSSMLDLMQRQACQPAPETNKAIQFSSEQSNDVTNHSNRDDADCSPHDIVVYVSRSSADSDLDCQHISDHIPSEHDISRHFQL